MRKMSFGAALGLSLLLSVPALGQGVSVEIGPRIGYDLGDVEELFIGADARFDIESLPVRLNPTFDYYFTEGIDVWQFSANALYDFAIGSMPNISPYVGAGLGISKISVDVDTPFGSFGGSSTDAGINLIGGGSIDAGGFKPFAQVQITLGDLTLATISLGALFSL